jgi:thioredoxin reductase (NADPH)
MEKIRNVIIIGSGSAGYTAAIYTSRALLSPILFTGAEKGGQISTTTEVENFPGFPDGIQGPDLMKKFKEQAEKFGTEIIDGIVEKVDFSKTPFSVWSGGRQYFGKSIVVATGASSLWLGIPSEQKLKGRGVSSCATCDGFFFKGKDIVVVGGGDSAMEESTYLTKFASKVFVVHRRDTLRASKIMQEKAKNNPKIDFVLNSEIVEILGDKKVEGVKIKNNKTGGESVIDCAGVFVAIGHSPNTEIFKGQVDLDEKGYIVPKQNTMTSRAGIFAAGDVVDHRYRQAITASADGCKAAIDVERWLEK